MRWISFNHVIKWLAFKETKLIINNSTTIDLIQDLKKNEREHFNTYTSWIFVSSMMSTLTFKKQTNQPKKSIKILIQVTNKSKKKIVVYIYFLFRHGSIFCFVIWFYFLLEIVLIYACGWLYAIVAHFTCWACSKNYEMFNDFIFWYLFLWKSTRDNYNQPHSSHKVMIAFIVFINFEMFWWKFLCKIMNFVASK